MIITEVFLHPDVNFSIQSVFLTVKFSLYSPGPPVSPSYSWILSSLGDKIVPGNPPLASHGTLEPVLGGMSFDGAQTSLSGTLPSTACVIDPDMCIDGFAVGMKLRFDELSLGSNKPQYVLDTGASDNYKGVCVFLQLNSLYFKIATSNAAYQVRLQVTATSSVAGLFLNTCWLGLAFKPGNSLVQTL